MSSSVHFGVNCHSGRSVTVDQKYSGRSVVVQMSLGRSVGGCFVKVPGGSPSAFHGDAPEYPLPAGQRPLSHLQED
jgi:hypothetical protein